MNDLSLSEHARQRSRDLEREAARQRLVRAYQRLIPTHSLTRTYCLVKGLFWFAVSLPAALYVLLLQTRGVTLGQIGFFYGLYAVVVALLEVPSGTLADRRGRKVALALGYTLTILAQLTFLFAYTPTVLLLWALLSGAGRALASGALEAWFVDRVYDVAPQTDLQPLFARAGTVELLALTLGTLFGGALPELFAVLPTDALLSPLSVPLAASVGTLLVLVGVVGYGVHEARSERAAHAGFFSLFRNTFTVSRRNPALRLLFVGSLLSGVALAGLETFWQPRFAALLGPETFLLGAILAGSFGAGALGNTLSVPFVRLLRGRHARVAALALGVGGAALILLALQTQALPATLLFWLVYLLLGVAGSPVQTLLNQHASSQARAALLSVGSLVTYVGFFLGSAVLGGLAERLSVGAAWGVAGAVLALSAFVYARLEHVGRQAPREPRPASGAAARQG